MTDLVLPAVETRLAQRSLRSPQLLPGRRGFREAFAVVIRLNLDNLGPLPRRAAYPVLVVSSEPGAGIRGQSSHHHVASLLLVAPRSAHAAAQFQHESVLLGTTLRATTMTGSMEGPKPESAGRFKTPPPRSSNRAPIGEPGPRESRRHAHARSTRSVRPRNSAAGPLSARAPMFVEVEAERRERRSSVLDLDEGKGPRPRRRHPPGPDSPASGSNADARPRMDLADPLPNRGGDEGEHRVHGWLAAR